jgi:hypothetical protein
LPFIAQIKYYHIPATNQLASDSYWPKVPLADMHSLSALDAMRLYCGHVHVPHSKRAQSDAAKTRRPSEVFCGFVAKLYYYFEKVNSNVELYYYSPKMLRN